MGPLLIDSDLGRSKKFFHHSSEYCHSIPFWTALKFMLPSFLYTASSWFLPPAWTIHRHLREVRNLVIPEIQRRRNHPTSANDVLQGLLELQKGADGRTSDQEVVDQMLFVLFAGAELHAVALCQFIYTAIAYPEYERELLKEIAEAVDAHPAWNKDTVAHMPKLDSFLKEVLRLNPPICCK
jgi:cytochrome P450